MYRIHKKLKYINNNISILYNPPLTLIRVMIKKHHLLMIVLLWLKFQKIFYNSIQPEKYTNTKSKFCHGLIVIILRRNICKNHNLDNEEAVLVINDKHMNDPTYLIAQRFTNIVCDTLIQNPRKLVMCSLIYCIICILL